MSVYLVDYENVGSKGLTGISKLKESDHVYIFYGKNTGSVPIDLMEQIINSPARVKVLRALKSAKNYLDFQLVTFSGYLVANLQENDYRIISKDTGFDAVVDFWNSRSEDVGNVKFTRTESLIPLAIEHKEVESKPVSTKKKFNKKQNALVVVEPVKEEVKPEPKVEEPVKEEVKPVELEVVEEPVAVVETPVEEVKEEKQEKLAESYRKKIREKVKPLKLKVGAYNKIYQNVVASENKEQLHNNLVKALKIEDGAAVYKLIVPVFEEFKKK